MSLEKDCALGQPRPHWKVKAQDSQQALALAAAIRNLASQKLLDCKSPRQKKLYEKLSAQDCPVLATLLLNRGITSAEAALHFLDPDLSWRHDWHALPDMDLAVARLELAREQGERVLIHGDYDADGITATALLVTALGEWGLAVDWYLPHRIQDGYGLSVAGIEYGHARGCTLLLTVDCGISNLAEVDYARNLGMDVIITDHHLPPDTLPRALAVVDPKRADSDYPFPELAGVGLAWKLAAALHPESPASSACLQLAALGTVADLVPLLDENRVLTKLGLMEINHNPLPGIAALAAAAGCELGKLDSANIAYALAPRLNAAGRMGSADAAVALLLERDPAVAASYAQLLQEENQHRRQVEDEIFQEALVQAQEQAELGAKVLVLHGAQWHLGVVGIVAARILDRYYRPAIILCGQEELTGSARSVPGFNIHAALTAVAQYLVNYGGHPGAAGLTIREENLALFRQAIDANAREEEIQELLEPVIEMDAVLTAKDIEMELVEEIGMLRPFGFGNPEPMFAIEGFRVSGLDLVGRDKGHLRLRLEAAGANLWAIGFGKASLVHNIDMGKEVTVAGNVHLNRWNGHTSVQLHFTDLTGPVRTRLQGREVHDRRKSPEPWISQLASMPGTIFLANTLWSAEKLLGPRAKNTTVIILPPDNYREKVYNLKAENFCFIDPAWTPDQLREIVSILPQGCQLHFFCNSATPDEVLRPNLNLLRQFYKGWREADVGVRSVLLSLLPPDLAEPLLLERILVIFAEAGLAGESQGEWKLVPVSGNVDLTATEAWARYSSELEDYRAWLQGFAAQSLEQLLA